MNYKDLIKTAPDDSLRAKARRGDFEETTMPTEAPSSKDEAMRKQPPAPLRDWLRRDRKYPI